MKEKRKKNKHRPIAIAVWSAVFGILFLAAVAAYSVCAWYQKTFDLEFKDLLYTLASPLKGTGESTMAEVRGVILPRVYTYGVLYVICALIVSQRGRLWKTLRRIGAAFCALVLVLSLIFAAKALRLPAYIKALTEKTTIYEDHYVDPNKVAITSDGKTKNLIYIYLESMETTYASSTIGGKQTDGNYMPLMTALAQQNVSFSDKASGELGGFRCPIGTGWTMAALLSTSSGIPFSFPLGEGGNNKMGEREYFASGLTTLGDILEKEGYVQEFLCGSDANFGGRRDYFVQHGNYRIFDYYTALEKGYVTEHNGWWGFDDTTLYQIAKDELRALADSDQPFNFTMLTVDTHHVDGYRCSLCGYEYGDAEAGEELLKNVVSCADRQLASFVAWIQEQDFYKDCVVIITGDHPRMDTTLIGETEYFDRTIYNCFLNAAPTVDETLLERRNWTSFDMFPTTLAAMGFVIEENRLGLGVDLFSGEPTLAEQYGFWYVNNEVAKFSDYYILKFS